MRNRRIITVCYSILLFISIVSAFNNNTKINVTKSNINLDTSPRKIVIESVNKDEIIELTEKNINNNEQEEIIIKEEEKPTIQEKPIKESDNSFIVVEKQEESITPVIENKISEAPVVVNKDVTEKVPKTLEEQNEEIIKEIKDIYGYDVSYGKEEFWYGGVASTQLTDEEKANDALIELKKKSKIFPNGFFQVFQGYNGFRILLFENIEGAAGVASYEFGDDNYIALNVRSDFLGRIFYHETFHIMEQYIRYKTYDETNPFDTWNLLNKEEFSYDYNDNTFDYTAYDFDSYNVPSDILFVSPYSKTSDKEDRAELFADLMFRGIKKNYMHKGFGINEKAKTLALIIRNYFPNSNGAYWERFIDWS